MRFRICDNTYHSISEEPNDIYRKFQYQFDNLLNADEVPQNDEEFRRMYVHDLDFEKAMDDFLRTYGNSMKFCVGYTGIGKTTSIRYCLGLGMSNVPRFTEKSKNSQNKYMIVFPTFLDGASPFMGGTFELFERIGSVCTALEREHPYLRDVFHTPQGRKDFYDFIANHTPRILETGDDFNFINCTYDDEIIGRVKFAQKHTHTNTMPTN